MPASVQQSATAIVSRIRSGQLRAGGSLLQIVGDTDPLVVAWQILDQQNSDRSPAIGFVADVSFVTGVFERILIESSLLPPSLGTGARDLLAVRVASGSGRPLFASSSAWSPYTSETALDEDLGGLRLAVALDPGAADTLIIGGLPRSRLPLLLGLVAVTAGLVTIALIQLRREQQLAGLRADFISGVSHELRPPLAQIRMFGETLLLGRVRSESERQRSLGIIVQESQRLTRLIENVLQFSRAGRSGPSLTLVPTRLDVLLHEILDGFALLANSKRAVIARRIQQDLTAPTDPGAFRQIMLNLLDNAVKYGPPGQTVTVEAGYEHGAARISVEDQGPGIDPEHAALVWQPFYRVPASAQVTGGTGIGLAIVKHLVNVHLGRVAVEHAAQVGARFVIELPAATLAEQSTEGARTAASG